MAVNGCQAAVNSSGRSMLTTFVGFGCAWGEAWDVEKIVTGLGRNELKRWKAAKLYDTQRQRQSSAIF